MYLIKNFADFLVSAWLWNLTFAFSYVFIATFCLTLLLKIVVGESLLRAFLLSVSAQVSTVIIFSGLVGGVIMYLFNWQYASGDISQMETQIDVLRACLSLGIVYAVIQTLFFWFLESYLKYSFFSYIIAVWLSNGATAFICYWLIHWVMSTSL